MSMGSLRPIMSLFVYNNIRRAFHIPVLSTVSIRSKASGPTDEGLGRDLTLGEEKLIAKLKQEFPYATHVQVSDISGGCGAMYQIFLESPDFKGKRMVEQHRMVNKALAKEIKDMHGLQLNTKVPDEE